MKDELIMHGVAIDELKEQLEKTSNTPSKTPPTEQKFGWIPAKEIQPEPGERVLVFVNEESLLDFDEIYKPYIGMYIAEGDWGVWVDDDPGMRLMNSNAVIAWMPITPYDSVEAVKALKEVKDKTTSHVAWILMEKRKPKSRQRVLYLYEMGDDGLRKQYSVESDYANRELNKIAKAWMPFIPFKE